MPFAADGHLMLLHRFEQRRLGLGRRAVDLVGENHVAEDRAFQELERPQAGGLVFLNDFGAGDVGRHQVGSELNAAELEREGLGQGADHQRLGQPWHADEQAVPFGEHRDQQLFDHLLLADDDLAQLESDAAIGLIEAANRLDVIVVQHEDSWKKVVLAGGLARRVRRNTARKRAG
jgi:hypothetical protein